MDSCVRTGAIPDYCTPLVIPKAQFERIRAGPLKCHYYLNLPKDDLLITGWHFALICGDAAGPWIAVQATYSDVVKNRKGDEVVEFKTSHVVAFPQFYEDRERGRRHDAQVRRERAQVRRERALEERAR